MGKKIESFEVQRGDIVMSRDKNAKHPYWEVESIVINTVNLLNVDTARKVAVDRTLIHKKYVKSEPRSSSDTPPEPEPYHETPCPAPVTHDAPLFIHSTLLPYLTFKGEIQCSCGDIRKIKKHIPADRMDAVIKDAASRHERCSYQNQLPAGDVE